MARDPLTFEETEFLNLLFLHLKTSYEAFKAGLPLPLDSLQRDIGDFLRLPAPARFWSESKRFYELHFQRFIEAALH